MLRTSLRCVLLLATALLAAAALAQETAPAAMPATSDEQMLGAPREPRVRILSPVTPWVDIDKTPRVLDIRKGLAVGGFHVYPGWEAGPYGGPPARIWSAGSWGTTLWRDPITGWPLQ